MLAGRGLGAAVWSWVLSRAIIIAAGIVGSVWLGPGHYGRHPSVPGWLTLLGSWDVNWYLRIATHGYEHAGPTVVQHWSDYAFFPLLPLIMRIGVVTETNPFVWGLVASNLALLAALVMFARLTEILWNARLARVATWALAFSPAAVDASLAYTDALLLACAVGAALASIRGRWWVAGALGATATLTRPQGALILVLIVLIAAAADDVPPMRRLRHVLIGVMPAAVAGAGFLLWMQAAHGSWSLPVRAQRAWGRTWPGPGTVGLLGSEIARIARYPFVGSDVDDRHLFAWSASVRDLLAVIVLAALFVALVRMDVAWHRAWVWFTGLALAIPLLSGSTQSSVRFSLVAFPLVWPVAAWLERRSVATRRIAVGAAAIILVGLTLQLRYAPP